MGAPAWRRVFSTDKLVDSPGLNRLGLQVFRTVAARGLQVMLPADVPAAVKEAVGTLTRDGIVALPAFLPADVFARLREEADWLERESGALTTRRSGGTRLDGVRVRELTASLPATQALLTDPRLVACLSAVERRPVDAVDGGEFEFVTCRADGDAHDPEWDLHSDIFFTTHKAWLYLDDVRLEDGPLAYVPGSHRLTPGRLRAIYAHSVTWAPPENGSRRIGPTERAGLQERVMTCAANTLVIANTSGFHRRVPGQPGARRRAAHVSARANPFTLPGLRAILTGRRLKARPVAAAQVARQAEGSTCDA